MEDLNSNKQMVTCKNCSTRQQLDEFFRFCELCKLPLDVDWADGDEEFGGDLSNSFRELPNADTSLNVPNMGASGQSFHSAASSNPIKMKQRKKSLIASKPIGFANKQAAPKKFVKSDMVVDWVILDEITEYVKFSAMNLVDNLLMMNSAPKMASMDKIKQHKHVKFVPPEPILFDPNKYAPRKVKKKKKKSKKDVPKDPSVTVDALDEDNSPGPESPEA